MNIERCCGCIIINNNDKVLLVLQRKSKCWSFPKGHVENNETEIETALREVKEETGIDVNIEASKRYELTYKINNSTNKNVVYFIARPLNANVKIQEKEILDYKWCDINKVVETLTYENTKDLFKKVIKDLK